MYCLGSTIFEAISLSVGQSRSSLGGLHTGPGYPYLTRRDGGGGGAGFSWMALKSQNDPYIATPLQDVPP